MRSGSVRFSSIVTFAVVLFVANVAQAQCPLDLASPLQLIDGSTWVFHTEDGAGGDATIGIFTAQAATNPRSPSNLAGILNIKESYNNAGMSETQVAATGSYQINADCSGGQLNLGGPRNSYQYTFVFMPGQYDMLLVTSNPSVPNTGMGAALTGSHGRATRLLSPPSCAGSLPTDFFAGTWSFLLQDYASASVGLLTAQTGSTDRAPGTVSGLLNGTVTTSGLSFLEIQAPVAGNYQVYGDCSGGEVNFSSGSAKSFAFVFASVTEIYMVSIAGDQTGTQGFFRGNHGVAYRSFGRPGVAGGIGANQAAAVGR